MREAFTSMCSRLLAALMGWRYSCDWQSPIRRASDLRETRVSSGLAFTLLMIKYLRYFPGFFFPKRKKARIHIQTMEGGGKHMTWNRGGVKDSERKYFAQVKSRCRCQGKLLADRSSRNKNLYVTTVSVHFLYGTGELRFSSNVGAKSLKY